MPKLRRHHNNKGRRQIKIGSHLGRLKKLDRELGVPVKSKNSQKGA